MFIGPHACKALHHNGFLPVVFDNLSTGHARAVRFGPMVQGDVRDAAAVAAGLRAHDASGIIHFAASAYVGESMCDPGHYYDNNLGSMIGLLKGAAAAGVLGEHHDPETHLITLALRAAAGHAPLQVFGTDYPTPDGTCIRDYIHVADLARAHVLILIRLEGRGQCAIAGAPDQKPVFKAPALDLCDPKPDLGGMRGMVLGLVA